MAGVVRLDSLTEGSVDAGHGRASFVLRFMTGQTLTCISDLGQIEDMHASLARIAQRIRRSSPQTSIAKDVLAYSVVPGQKDGSFLLRLTTPGGVSHVFAIAADWAAALAVQLGAQAERPEPGS